MSPYSKQRLTAYIFFGVNGALVALLIASFPPYWTLRFVNDIEGGCEYYSLWCVMDEDRSPRVVLTLLKTADDVNLIFGAMVLGVGFLGGIAICAARRRISLRGQNSSTSPVPRSRLGNYLMIGEPIAFAAIFVLALTSVGKRWHPCQYVEPENAKVAGWMGIGNRYVSLQLESDSKNLADAVPSFGFTRHFRNADDLAKLKDPGEPFGLDFSGSGMTDDWMRYLAAFEHLQALNLNGTNVSDAGLKQLAALKQLRMLDIGRTAVTDAGLKDLTALHDLQVLCLSAHISDEGLKRLPEFQRLRVLELDGDRITEAGLKEVSRIKSLQSLDIRGRRNPQPMVTDVGLKHLAGLPNLQALYLWGPGVTDASLKALAGLKGLRRLESGGSSITDAGLKELAAFKDLQTLNLPYVQITGVGLPELPCLEFLDLRNSNVTDKALEDICRCTKLRELDLSNTHVSNFGVKQLERLKKLQRLRIYGTDVTNDRLRELQKSLPGCEIRRQ